MKIERGELLEKLYQFSLAGSGVVVGRPGSGKSYSLIQLRERLKKEGAPYLFLPIERFENGESETLQRELKFEGDFVDQLLSIPCEKDKPGILIFDGIDAARNSDIQGQFLRLIQRCKTKLAGHWNVIVSMRTFDAQRSDQILSIFEKSSPVVLNIFHDSSISCRHFSIPLLRAEELELALPNTIGLNEIYASATEEFKTLLKVPFNLWLLIKLLKAGCGNIDFSRMRSEIELLNLYWKHYVDSSSDFEDKRHLLSKVVREMVSTRMLSVRRDFIYDPNLKSSWSSLMSDEIIVENSKSGQRIGFSHNIIFDYAVSALLIDNNADEFKRFLAEDASRQLFLRPSFQYFFTDLWFSNRVKFWELFWNLSPSTDPNLRIAARLTPTITIVNESCTLDDLAPVLDKLGIDPTTPEVVLRIFQAYSFLDSEKSNLWINFVERLSENPRKEYLWYLVNTTSKILKASANDDHLKKTVGIIARRLFEYTWNERSKKVQPWIDNIASQLILPLVAEVFDTDPVESRRLLAPVLELTGEPNFPISYIYRLSSEVDKIWGTSPDFVGEIYLNVFGYEETSVAPTQMGTPVLSLVSNRRQDYDMCHYQLARLYPAFLRTAPVPAMKTALACLNTYVVEEHIYKHRGEANRESLRERHFDFRGKTATIVDDYSYIWDQRSTSHDDQLKLADSLFRAIEISGKEKSVEFLEETLNYYRDNAKVAFLWRKLLEIGAAQPAVFSDLLFELAVSPSIQISADTLHELGLFIQNSFMYLSKEKQERLERSLLAIPDYKDQVNLTSLDRVRDRLLTRIPRDKVITAEAKLVWDSLEKSKSVPQNEPLSSMTFGSRKMSEDDWLLEKGVDLETPNNKKLRTATKALSVFISQHFNTAPSEDDSKKVLSDLMHLQSLIKGSEQSYDPVLISAWTELASAASTLVRSSLASESKEFQTAKIILLDAAHHAEPRPDPDRDKNYSSPSWSPSPRTAAAEGLPRVYEKSIGQDLKVFNEIEKLAMDPDPGVRYLTARSLSRLFKKAPDSFWKIIFDRATVEKNDVVLTALSGAVVSVTAADEINTIKAVELFWKKIEESSTTSEFQKQVLRILIWLHIFRKNASASVFLDGIISKPSENAMALEPMVLESFQYLTPDLVISDHDSFKEVVTFISRCIEASIQVMGLARKASPDQWDEHTKKIMKGAYATLDEVVTRVYFASDVNPSLRHRGDDPISFEKQRAYYVETKPLLNQVLEFAEDKDNGILFASTALHFINYLRGTLRFDPSGVIEMAKSVVLSSEPYNFNLDGIAATEVAKLVETALADHKDVLSNPQTLTNVLDLLDVFAKAGWKEALNLVWRLDEVFR